ncbi:MAG: 50S ribosomal protein L25 [Chloroflexi bacterium]|nr:50S ribosomal protein L25 [Chloroflexota bacterium]
MEQVVLKAERRNVLGKKVKQLRREGKLPAVLYGKHIDPIPLVLDFREASKALRGLSTSTLVILEVEGQRHTAVVRERQKDYIKNTLLHVDFQALSLTEKMRVEVPIELEGEAPAVKTYGGILVQTLESVEVESLPGDMPERLIVDLSNLQEIGDSITVADLVLPPHVRVLEDPDETIVVITAPRSEEEIEAASGMAEESEEPEVIAKGKAEEEEEEAE